MFEWSEQQKMIREAVRQFVEKEVAPLRDELEFGDTPPYDVLRKMVQTFGLDQMATERFRRSLEREKAAARGEEVPGDREPGGLVSGDMAGMAMIPVVELSR